MKVNFIVVNYYSHELIKKLYQSILENEFDDFQLNIVNNSPDDDLFDLSDEKDEKIKIFVAPRNLGFGRACNLALDYIYERDFKSIAWLINPDAQLDKTAIKTIINCLENNTEVAILGTKTRNDRGKTWFSYGTFNPSLGYLKHHTRIVNTKSDRLGLVEIVPSRWVSGCSLIINLERFDCCPKFDPFYFLYCEDADLCEKYYQQGYQIAITQETLVTHQVSAIAGKNTSLMFRYYCFSKLYFMYKNAKISGFIIYCIYFLASLPKTLLFFPSKGIGQYQGLKDFIRLLITNEYDQVFL